MIGVVVPAHDEQACIEKCLEALKRSARHPLLLGEQVHICVVLDDCSDSTEAIVRNEHVSGLQTKSRNVGIARDIGARDVLARGARWLAFTDADTVVADDWLVQQLALGADGVCGVVAVRDWSPHGAIMQDHFSRTYHDRDDHRHIHGANLGISAAAYQRVGGFSPLATGEDVELVRKLVETGANIAWSARPRVTTSARTDFRAPDGFGATLKRIHRDYDVQARNASAVDEMKAA